MGVIKKVIVPVLIIAVVWSGVVWFSHKKENTPVNKEQESTIYFKNCSDAKSKGYWNIRRGEPGYSQKLDRDNDGIACEK